MRGLAVVASAFALLVATTQALAQQSQGSRQVDATALEKAIADGPRRADPAAASRALDAACPADGDGIISFDVDEATAKERRRVAAIYRRAGDAFGADGRYEFAFRAYLCALRGILPDNKGGTGPLIGAQRAVLGAMVPLLVRWQNDDAPDFRRLRGLLGSGAELVREYARRRAELDGEARCIADYLKHGALTGCEVASEPEEIVPRTAGALGQGPQYGAGDTSSAIMTSSLANLGLDPPSAATSDTLLAMTAGFEQRWGDAVPVAVTARWLRGLASLANGKAADAARWMPDADATAHQDESWMGQLLLARSRARRASGDSAGALADSARAREASGISVVAALEQAENLRTEGRLREAEEILDPRALKTNGIGRFLGRGGLPKDPADRARLIAEWADWLARAHRASISMAPLADALRHCRPFDPSLALRAFDDVIRECPKASDAPCEELEARRTLDAAARRLREGPDIATCDRVAAALANVGYAGEDDLLSAIENDRGITYYAEGRYAEAIARFGQAEAGTATEVLRAIGNAAGAAFSMGDIDQASLYLERAVALADRGVAPAREHVALLANMGKVKLAGGDLLGTQKDFEKALRELDATKLPDQELRAQVLDDVGIGQDLAGHRDVAEKTYREALALREELSEDAPGVATSLGHLATLYWAQGDPRRGLPLFGRMQRLQEQQLVRLLLVGSDESKRAAVEKVAESVDWLATLDLLALHDDRDATALAFSALVSRQGRALDAAARTQEALFGRAAGDARDLLERLRSVESRIAWLVLQGPRGATPEERREAASQLRTLYDEERRIQESLRAKLGPLDREAVAGLEGGPAALAHALRRGQALVTYVLYRPFHPERVTERFSEPHYAAYVLMPDGIVEHRELGPAAQIDELVGRWREALASRAPHERLGAELATRLFDPIVTLLGSAHDLFVVPDGALYLVPFDAMWTSNGPVLDAYRISTLTSARDLASLAGRRSGGSDIVVFADPAFGEPLPPSAVRRDEGLLAGVRFTPLPGTSAEARGIGAVFPRARLLLGDAATGPQLRTVQRPQILHVATHGFFLGAAHTPGKAACSGSCKPRGLVLDDSAGIPTAPPAEEIPALLRSGLAFAGANRHDEGSLVVGFDLAHVDLSGTRLVTLSACESGVGEAISGDGVYGIRRALYLAGSETQVLSLWKVDDEATARLMASFYGELAAGWSRGEALRRAKRSLAATPQYAHPFYWAAFLLNGSPDKLDGSPDEPVEPAADLAHLARIGPPHACGCRFVGGSTEHGWAAALAGALLAVGRRRFSPARLTRRGATARGREAPGRSSSPASRAPGRRRG
jgi:CHAT domain-containing protein/tetratricopeptide (TPR) repeat protein